MLVDEVFPKLQFIGKPHLLNLEPKNRVPAEAGSILGNDLHSNLPPGKVNHSQFIGRIGRENLQCRNKAVPVNHEAAVPGRIGLKIEPPGF